MVSGRRLSVLLLAAGLFALALCAFHAQLVYYSACMFRDAFLGFIFAALYTGPLLLAFGLWSLRRRWREAPADRPSLVPACAAIAAVVVAGWSKSA